MDKKATQRRRGDNRRANDSLVVPPCLRHTIELSLSLSLSLAFVIPGVGDVVMLCNTSIRLKEKKPKKLEVR